MRMGLFFSSRKENEFFQIAAGPHFMAKETYI